MKRYTILIIGVLFSTGLTVAQFTPRVLWDRSGASPQAGYGASLLPLGDQNGDGYADWAVWAGMVPDTSGRLLEFFHGGDPVAMTPYRTFFVGVDSVWQFGPVQAVGDINGDGYVDWMAWMRYYAIPGTYTIHFYLGGPDAGDVPVMTLHAPRDNSTPQLEPLGDFNGDGYDDLAYRRSYNEPLMILYGSASPDTVADWQAMDPPDHHYNAYNGSGDVNGDGYADLVNAVLPPIYLDLFLGGAHPDTVPSNPWQDTNHVPTIVINDLNGDERADLMAREGEGGYHLATYFGGSTLSAQPDVVLDFGQLCDGYVDAVRSLGDINGDGWNDVIAINSNCSMGWGRLALFLGSPNLSPYPAWTLSGRTPPLDLIGIWEAAGLGDVNGDGINDFAVGALNGDGDGLRGRVVVLSGDTAVHVGIEPPLVELPQELTLSVYPNPFNSTTEIRYTVPRAAHVSLKVFDVMGREVCVLVDAVMAAREHQVAFDARNLASGIYFVRLAGTGGVVTRKVLLVR